MSTTLRLMGAIIFDLDDTLFDHAAAMARFLAREFGFSGAVVRRFVELDARGREARERFCAAVGAEALLSGDEVWVRIETMFGKYARLEAPEVLATAVSRFDVGLLTNGGSRVQRTKISTLGLGELLGLEQISVSGEIDLWKPDPRAFEHALRALGVSAHEAVYVGDHAKHDIQGALSAGMRTCWVARGRTFPDTPLPDWTIDTLADLPRVWDEFPT